MNIQHLNKTYQQEVKELVTRLEKSQLLAEKFPVFKNHIIETKLQESSWVQFGEYYKGMRLAWGINRGYYENGTRRTMANNTDVYKGYFFNIYVNTVSLYDSHEVFDLYDRVERYAYYSDHLNSTFYVLDENIEKFLDSLVDWYGDAKEKITNLKKAERINKLEKELNSLKETE